MNTPINPISFIEQFGYVTIFIIIAVENIEFFGSIPTSLIAAAVGAAAAKGVFTPWVAILLLTLASVVGDVIAYWLGRTFGRGLLTRWGGVLTRNGRLEKTEKFFGRFGAWGVFISRFIFASFQAIINILAGIAKMRFFVFFFTALFGELVWSIFWFYLGYYFWPFVSKAITSIGNKAGLDVILIVVGAAVLFAIIYKQRARIRSFFKGNGNSV